MKRAKAPHSLFLVPSVVATFRGDFFSFRCFSVGLGPADVSELDSFYLISVDDIV
jgi:hypothetical protein